MAEPAALIVSTIAGLEALRPEWEALWRRCREATPLQSPAWQIAWWRSFAPGALVTCAVRRRGRLTGLLPLYAPEPGRLLPVGVGISDYLDALAETPEDANQLLGALGDNWHECELPALPPGSWLLEAASPPGWTASTEMADPCPVLVLPGTEEALEAAVPRSMMRELRYCRRRLDRLGSARIEMADGSNLDELLDALLHLHAARWVRRGEAGVLADERVQRFHRLAAPALLEIGALRLYALRLDGRIVAVYHGFADARRAYYYLGGFEPELARLSLGTVIVGHAIEAAWRAGAREFHFLRGGEPYKYAWGAVDRFNRRRVWRRLMSRHRASRLSR